MLLVLFTLVKYHALYFGQVSTKTMLEGGESYDLIEVSTLSMLVGVMGLRCGHVQVRGTNNTWFLKIPQAFT